MILIKLSFLSLIYLAEGHLSDGLLSISITRQNKGDVFSVLGDKYYKELCKGFSGGTAEVNEENEYECRCQRQHPVYRDDLNVCVDDIQECSLVPFVSGTTIKKIPYVFLPLKGQIVYPSAEIVIAEYGTPVCVVSGGQYLGRNGWMNLRNNSDTEPPFRLFRDEERTYLQWFGETSMRMAMEGRIILVNLMCKDASFAEEPKIFTPCVAFRVAGNPSVREMMFSSDVQLTPDHSGGLSKREYVAIGLCSLFLAIVYVASVFLYLHWRKQRKRKNNKKNDESAQLTLGEEGIIKNNPLLQANRHLGVCEEDNAGYMTDSNSCGSDPDRISDLLCLDDDDLATHQNVQTSAIIHPCDMGYGETTLSQDANNIERLPEENVSIIETLEAKEVHPETIKAIVSANGRRKLYFNPSYFEPELLKAPPPAALEFLVKIREVIAIAKHKMSNKKFSPSLLGIPEEEGSMKTENNVPRTNSSVSKEKPMHPTIAESSSEVKGKNFRSMNSNGIMQNEFLCPSEVKQKIIQKWLEDVPIMVSKENKANEGNKEKSLDVRIPKKINPKQPNQTCKSKSDARKIKQEAMDDGGVHKEEKRRPSTKTRPPPLPPQNQTNVFSKPNCDKFTGTRDESEQPKIQQAKNINFEEQNKNDSNEFTFTTCGSLKHSSPTLCNSLTQEDGSIVSRENTQNLNYTKNLMDAVIQELTGIKKHGKPFDDDRKESLRRNKDMASKPKSDHEATNEIPVSDRSDQDVMKDEPDDGSKKDGNYECNSKNNYFPELLKRKPTAQGTPSNETQDEHEYEIILLNGEIQIPSEKDRPKKNSKNYNMSEVFSRSEKNEGYSLVSEVYVNDEHNSYGQDFSPNSQSSPRLESEKISYEVMNEKTSRLTIHVKDSPRQNKEALSESDSFEPDTLERKQDKSKNVRTIENTNDTNDRYSNQRFHDLDRRKKADNPENNESFTDSLERPTILLKTNGSFKRNSLEKDVNELFRNLNWARMENFGSLREIYEAKSRHHRRRTETTSLIDSVNSESDCISTLSWGEERRNKLLHRGIILHIDEDIRGQNKGKFSQKKTPSECTERLPLKPPSSKSQSKFHLPPSRMAFLSKTSVADIPFSSLKDASPPLPPPRSLPVSPEPQINNNTIRSTTPSPVNMVDGGKINCHSPSPPPGSHSVLSMGGVANIIKHNNNNNNDDDDDDDDNNNNNNSINNKIVQVFSKPECSARCHSILVSSNLKTLATPPRPPKNSTISVSSPPLPPRSSKPPLPPKNPKTVRSKFATRPLPPLPSPRPSKTSTSPTASTKDLETLSTLSGASADSLNSSEYESFYTLPYEEDGDENCSKNALANFCQSNDRIVEPTTSSISLAVNQRKKTHGYHLKNQKMLDIEKKSFRKRIKAAPHKVDDSGYLSTDSSESYLPQSLLSSQIPRIPEGIESFGGQNSETEESICDGASESGAESTATDSFFYGNFNKENGIGSRPKTPGSQVYSYSLRLSDVEVNSDTERHCVPILVRP